MNWKCFQPGSKSDTAIGGRETFSIDSNATVSFLAVQVRSAVVHGNLDEFLSSWNFVLSDDGLVAGTLVFRANPSG
jgi:hypothetical protein